MNERIESKEQERTIDETNEYVIQGVNSGTRNQIVLESDYVISMLIESWGIVKETAVQRQIVKETAVQRPVVCQVSGSSFVRSSPV